MINKFDMQQDIERVLVSEEDIHARIREVGAQISEDYRGKCPILVGVLKGVVPFSARCRRPSPFPCRRTSCASRPLRAARNRPAS